jgi:hypothetical protein
MTRFIVGCLLLVAALVLLPGCGDDVRPPSVPKDATAPSRVTDLSVTIEGGTSIVLSWSAPSDDSPSGRASAYDIRYSTSVLSEESWTDATHVHGEPQPQDPGTLEQFTVPNLPPDTSYYFALRALDFKANASNLSNVVLLDVDPPSAIADLQVTASTSRSLTLEWTAPSDNGSSGRASSYDIRFAGQAISEGNWDSATEASRPPSPRSGGTRQSYVLSGLDPFTLYYVAIRSVDSEGNLSSISNVVEAMTAVAPQGWWDGFSGQGADDDVSSLMSFGGNLVAGGMFTQAGSIQASRVAAWDGSSWSAIGQGFTGSLGTVDVRVLTQYNGDLIACGSFGFSGSAVVSNVARWDGSAWGPLGTGTDGLVGAAATYGGDLYIGGLFYTVGGQDINVIARWDGSSWHSMDWNLFFTTGVVALEVYDGELIAGGNFSRAADTPAENIAAWDGQAWRRLGDGFSKGDPITTVTALAVYQGELIAAGSFQFSGTTPLNNIARWDGTAWSPLGGGLSDDSGMGFVGALAVYNGTLVAGGRFNLAGGQSVNNIARWNGGAWETLGDGLTGDDPYTGVRTLAVHDGSLFVGGNFSTAGDISSDNIARWDD